MLEIKMRKENMSGKNVSSWELPAEIKTYVGDVLEFFWKIQWTVLYFK